MKKLLFILSLLAVPTTPISAASAQTVNTTRTIDMTLSDAGQTLLVKAGDILRFTVSNPAGTGYTWHALDVDPDYLVLVDKTTAAAPARKPGQPPIVGGPGPGITYVYYVKKSLNLGGYTVTSPIIFTNVPPARSAGQALQSVQFNLTSK